MRIIDSIDKAIAAAAALPRETEFTLKDLFQGTQWSSFAKGYRLSLGRQFKNEISNNPNLGITFIGKASNGSSLYKKIS